MSEPLLKVEDLCVKYRGADSAAVSRVGFSLDAGATLGVIGESGAGKSTLALALMGLLDKEKAEVSGNTLLRGRPLFTLSEKEFSRIRGRRVAMIFQDPIGSLDSTLRIDAQVAEAIRIHSDPGKDVAIRQARLHLAQVGIGPDILKAAPYPHQLSGGLCQRVMIAIALAAGPELLIADEPTSSLDTILQLQIIKLIKHEQLRFGLSLLFVSHDLALVSRIADQIMVMYRGKQVELGSTDAVITAPEHPYTRELLDAWQAGRPKEGAQVGPA